MKPSIKVFWTGKQPSKCEVCSKELTNKFYEATTMYGYWAIMCDACFHLGPGLAKLGTGYGQKYEKQLDGTWLKTGG